MRKTLILSAYLVLGTLGLGLMESDAADVYLEASRPDFQKIPIGVLSFQDGTPGTDHGQRVEEILIADLRRSHVFEVTDLTRVDATLNGEDGANHRLFEQASDKGLAVVVGGHLTSEDADLLLDRYIYDRGNEGLGAPKRYIGRASLLRMMTHRLADELVYRYVGEPGIARTKIAFVSGTGGSRELFVMDYDGYSPRQVTANGLLNISPSWSPKRRFLIYTSYKHRTRQNIEIIELETGKRHTLVSWAGMNITPAFSPDGTQLTFSTTRDGNAEIYKMDMRTRLAKRLTANRAGDLSPSWSPTGRELAFTSDRSGGPQIYLMSGDGSHVRRLTFHGKYNAAPAWSPRGNWIAYVCRGRGKFKICLISPDGRKRKTITSGPGIDDSPSWSPDGRHLVFSSTLKGKSHIYMINIDGTGLERLTFGGSHLSFPAWSPA